MPGDSNTGGGRGMGPYGTSSDDVNFVGSGSPGGSIPTQTISQSELNRLVEQIRALREALRPFAIFGDALPAVIEGQPRITDGGPAFACKSPRDPMGDERVITFADLRAAKALLDSLEVADEKRFIARIERQLSGAGDVCIARDCQQPIPDAEPHNLRGFCSLECEKRLLAAELRTRMALDFKARNNSGDL